MDEYFAKQTQKVNVGAFFKNLVGNKKKITHLLSEIMIY